jgi:hypothetical protein
LRLQSAFGLQLHLNKHQPNGGSFMFGEKVPPETQTPRPHPFSLSLSVPTNSIIQYNLTELYIRMVYLYNTGLGNPAERPNKVSISRRNENASRVHHLIIVISLTHAAATNKPHSLARNNINLTTQGSGAFTYISYLFLTWLVPWWSWTPR